MFWVKFGLIAIIVFVLISTVKFLLRKIFKVEKVKRTFFSYNHINDSHRKVDKWVRTFTVITLIILAILVINYKELSYLYLIGVITLLTVDYTIRAFFEMKYSKHPKQAILTLAEMFLMLIAILIVFQYWIA
ncbi:DUF4181 domain-containing protein [Bacillus haikouensis]|uniref:DUF4181 domain-containing protein n=1 Tax=Bacillus haikouensis TaxID=1510468 RepID=UPI001553CDBC|nr:DUF4181 domain-containing protein [Bacillus haikouensis]NQD67951.1 DUF4181 domain-containing protein [Bacillus haikouensis]